MNLVNILNPGRAINLFAGFLGTAWFAILNLFFTPIYFSYLGAEGYGLIGIYTSIYSVSILFDVGLSNSLNRKLASLNLDKKNFPIFSYLKTIETIYFFISISIFTLIFFSANFISKNWINASGISTETIRNSICFMGFCLLFQLPINLYSSGFLGLQKHLQLNSINIVLLTLKFVGTIFLLEFYENSVQIFFIWQAVITLTHLIVLYIYFIRNLDAITGSISDELRINKKINYSLIKGDTIKFAVGSAGISLTEFFLTQMDKIILSKFLTLEQFGYYSLAFTIASVTTLFIRPVCNTAFPELVQKFKNSNLIPTKEFLMYAEIICILLIPMTSIICFFSDEILFLWTKNDLIVKNSSILLRYVIIGNLFYGISRIVIVMGLAKDITKLTVIHQIGLIIVYGALFIFSEKLTGFTGAFGWFLVNGLFTFISVYYLLKKIGVHKIFEFYKYVYYNLFFSVLVLGIFYNIFIYFRPSYIFLFLLLTCLVSYVIIFLFSSFRNRIWHLIKI